MHATWFGIRMEEESKIREYLLGGLSETERGAFEAAYFADDGLFERLALAEESLAHDYLAGALGPEDRARLAGRLSVSPGLARFVAVTREIENAVRSLPQAAEPASPLPASRGLFTWFNPPRLVFASAALVVLVLAAVVVRRNGGAPASGGAAPLVASERPPETAASGEFTVRLEPELARGSQAASAVVAPASAQTLRLQLLLNGVVPPSNCRVEVRAVDSRRGVWSGACGAVGHVGAADVLEVTLPLDRVPAGDDYIVEILGANGRAAGYFIRFAPR